ncbi:glycosyltransferase family 2 protein [Candidatus Dependentiae bacterium]|jgi:glycosyltransferase involved in cell wall biosynthesis|nr:glycosyltransferase family 2 protein [Candidatus Dependentiae bacterium]
MKKISIIVACYNEASNIEEMHERVSKVMKSLPTYDYELVLIDNASTDNSLVIFNKIVAQDDKVHVLLMSRNFGSNQPSLLAGMRYAHGDCTIALDGDLQDPPELIPEFIKKWEEGFNVVYGIRKKRKGSILRRIGYTCFYRIFKWLSYLDIPLDAGDTCLIDRKVLNIINSLPEKDLYIRGLRTWAGFKQTGLEYVREDRAGGRSSNSFFANFSWVKKAIVNFSYKPLEFISRLAIIAVCITIIAAFFYLYCHFRYGAPQGFSTLLMVMFIFGSIQMLALSIIGEYLIRIFQEVKARPPYLIGEVLHRPINRTRE